MASNVTLLSLRNQAKERSDMANSSFVSDATWNLWLNTAAGALYDKLVAIAEDYYTQSTTISLDGVSDTATLPADFYKMIAIDYTLNGSVIPMNKFQFRDRLVYQNQTQGIFSELRYRLVGSKLKFDPLPSAQTMTLWYIPVFPKLVNDSDTLDGVNGWEDFIIIHAARKGLAKEESDTGPLSMELAEIAARIEEMGKNRDMGLPERVTDVTLQNRYPRFGFTP